MPESSPCYVEVVVPVPLFQAFDYRVPEGIDPQSLMPGMRVWVQFGPRRVLGVINQVRATTLLEPAKVRPFTELVDDTPALDEAMLNLLRWAAQYYCHPLGEVLHHALPAALRQGKPAHFPIQTLWRVTTSGRSTPADSLKGIRQQQLLAELQHMPNGLTQEALRTLEYSSQTLSSLEKRELIEKIEREQRPGKHQGKLLAEVPHSLSTAQQQVLEAIASQLDGFHVHLLDGVTGSGKTEVYLQLIEQVLRQGKQVLVLVPEIGLTPQTLRRFRHRFQVNVAIMHSGMNDTERLHAWLEAREASACILIGTRSALMAPMPNLGLIVIDEEHDASFKQQEGFRYHARDLAIVRAQRAQVPVLLGSATPSLESLHNALRQHYRYHRLDERAGNAIAPTIERLDIRKLPLQDGFSEPLLARMQAHLEAGQQVLVFLNRRGFAPSLHCPSCGWLAECEFCDARMTLHKRSRSLNCHHCDHMTPIPLTCPECHQPGLEPVGQGTERGEDSLQQHFPETPVIRIDRDTVRGKTRMETLLEPVHKGEPCILVGTQMLAKGHHFPNVTLVAIIDADQGLFSADFRGMERMAQLLVQVAGRAGRADKAGEVILQTAHADHPLIETLCDEGYRAFAQQELISREHVGLPPWQPMALLRADHQRPNVALNWLQEIRDTLTQHLVSEQRNDCQLAGPLPASMERRHDRYRALLHLYGDNRKALHYQLHWLCALIELNPVPGGLRWSLDVDPADTF
ncbi:primosomal protein N' [Pokkaliibacter sp. CJK22405]|uniref:primosomal protein N' n=1 Tax=Pokkaliibacter sp. CJK22405 TaxID=3384615 RepID=UPI003984A259